MDRTVDNLDIFGSSLFAKNRRRKNLRSSYLYRPSLFCKSRRRMSGNRLPVSTWTSERKEALRTVEEESTRLEKLLCSADICCRYNYTATCFRLWMQTGISVSRVGSYLQVHNLDSSREEELCMSKISIPWSPWGNVKLQHEYEDSITNKFTELSRGWLSINSKLQESRFASRICNRQKFHLKVSVIHTDTFCTLLLLHLWQDVCVPIFLHRYTPCHFDKKHSKEEDAKQETNITKLLEELMRGYNWETSPLPFCTEGFSGWIVCLNLFPIHLPTILLHAATFSMLKCALHHTTIQCNLGPYHQPCHSNLHQDRTPNLWLNGPVQEPVAPQIAGSKSRICTKATKAAVSSVSMT